MAELYEKYIHDVINASHVFAWKVYKKTSNPLRHIGVVVFLDNMRAFTVDITSREGKKRLKKCFLKKVESEGVIHEATFNEVETISDFIQMFDINDEPSKEYVKEQIRGWVDVTEKYDLLKHNCRDHTENCIQVARRMHEAKGQGKMELNQQAIEQAFALIENARKTDGLLAWPLRFMAGIKSLFTGQDGPESNQTRPKKNFLQQ